MSQNLFEKRPLANSIRAILLGGGTIAIVAGAQVATASDVNSLGARPQSNDADPAFVETVGYDPIGIKIPASETVVTVGGYVKGTANFDDSSDLGDSFIVSSIPADGTAEDDEDGHFRLHARQSRLAVRSTTELEGGTTLKTHFEGDFFGGGGNESFSNSTGFRLRHAYATYGAWTIGQTWTNFMDFVAYPGTVDFFGPAGKSFIRQYQVRYTMSNGLSFSIENPETDGGGALGRLRESTGGLGEDRWPDLTAAWRGGPGGIGGSYELAAVVRFLGVNGENVVLDDDGEVISSLAVDEDETGVGINLAGGWEFGPATLSASVTFGDGIGRYLINGAGNDVFVNADGSVDTVESLGSSINLKYDWNGSSSSLISFGHFENDDPDSSNGIDNLQTVHLNYIFSPYPRSTFGVELIQGFLESADGTDGDATRLAFGAQLNF